MLYCKVENIIEGMQICQVIGTRNTLGDEYIKGTSVKSSHWTHDNHIFLLINKYRTTWA